MAIKQNVGGSVSFTVPASATYFYPLVQGFYTASALSTEAQAQTKYYNTGTLRNAYIYVSTNSAATATTIKSRVNGADGTISFTVTAATTGYFEDTTGTQTIAANDLVCLTVIRSTGGTFTSQLMGAYFDADTSTAYLPVGCNGSNTFSTASSTTSVPIMGQLRSGVDSLTGRIPALTTVTLKKLMCYVSANTRGTSSTVKLRKTASDAGPSITVSAASTGLFEDTSSTASFVATDQMSYHAVLGTGTGNFTVTNIASDFDYSSRTYQIFWCIITGATFSGTSTQYICPSGSQSPNGFEVNTQYKLRGSGSISNFNAYVSSSTTTATATMTVRKNNADTAVTFTIGIAATGQFSDTSNSVTYADGDYIAYSHSKPTGAGNTIIRWATSLLTVNSEFTPQVRYY